MGPPIVSNLNKLRYITPDLITEVLKSQHNLNLASKFFHWAFKQKGFHHTFDSNNAFAYGLSRSNQDEEINVKPRVFLYNRIIDALMKNGNDGLVEKSVTFMVLIEGLCKVGRIDEKLKVLSKMRENLCTTDVFAYTVVVRVLVEVGNLDGCLRVWEEMKRDKVKPDAMVYTTLVTALCKVRRVEKGYELFREMKEKRCLIYRTIYGSLVEAFVAGGKVGFACADLGIYNSIIEGLCGVTVQVGLKPKFVTVNPILVLYAEMRRMYEFCKLLTQMEKLGFCVIDDLSKFFAFVVGKEERTMMAVEVLEDLKKRGYCSVSIYNILMGALHKKGEFKKVISLFNEVKESNFEPDSLTYSIVIECFVEIGDIEKACLCYNKIMEMSLVPSVAAYCALAKGLCKTGDIDAAMMLFKYTLSIVHACKSGDAEKMIKVIYSAIISNMCKYGTIEEARKVFSNLRDRKVLTKANIIVYDEMLIKHMKKKTADLVVSRLKFFGLESKLKAKGSTLLSS
ncbi:hypothetical protein RGQ29_018795 [Quercus rubra]|uniref:Pentatricopeptide repeat-containing protein n=1 Tax=Quercus rubra TaxID=3512 RepID=A0AAN7F8Y8_QUERU|nr:hypothetical protein RGQ29_018795 [Quercus rubra]